MQIKLRFDVLRSRSDQGRSLSTVGSGGEGGGTCGMVKSPGGPVLLPLWYIKKVLAILGIFSLNEVRSRQVMAAFTSSLLYCYKQLLHLGCASTEKQNSNHGIVG